METTTTTLVSLPKFNGKGENWPKHKRSIIVLCKTARTDPYGSLPEMFSPEEFLKVTNENITQFPEHTHSGPEPIKPPITASAADKRDYVENCDL